MQFLEENEQIRNKKRREITHVKDSDKMKRILRQIAAKKKSRLFRGRKFDGIAY
jgi:hypothetical protein